MAAFYTIALSDAAVVVTGLAMAWKVLAVGHLFAACGFTMISVAASVGVNRFSRSQPSADLVAWHRFISWWAQAVGLPFIAASFIQPFNSLLAIGFAVFSIIVATWTRRTPSADQLRGDAGELFGMVAVVSILGIGCWTYNGYAIVGAVLFAVAGLLVGTEGEIGLFLRVNVFHYILSVVIIALMKGLLPKPVPDIFYKG